MSCFWWIDKKSGIFESPYNYRLIWYRLVTIVFDWLWWFLGFLDVELVFWIFDLKKQNLLDSFYETDRFHLQKRPNLDYKNKRLPNYYKHLIGS